MDQKENDLSSWFPFRRRWHRQCKNFRIEIGMISDWVSRETVWCCGISYCLFVLFRPGVLLDESQLMWDLWGWDIN